MTAEQTRQLGIEFERRLIEVYPQFKFDEKLDTDTIYSFLSEYQQKYVNDLFLLEDQTERGSKSANKINDTIKSLIKHKRLAVPERQPDADDYSDIFYLPTDYYLYIRSNSILDKTYKHQVKTEKFMHTPNAIIRQIDVPSVVGSFYNSGGIIRTPMVVLESTLTGSDYLKVIHDKYTHIDAVDLVYCRQPYRFNILNYDDKDDSKGAVHSYCELPFSCFQELVEGAVQMYITNYKFALSQKPKSNNEDK